MKASQFDNKPQFPFRGNAQDHERSFFGVESLKDGAEFCDWEAGGRCFSAAGFSPISVHSQAFTSIIMITNNIHCRCMGADYRALSFPSTASLIPIATL